MAKPSVSRRSGLPFAIALRVAALLFVCFMLTGVLQAAAPSRGEPWPRHVIDDSSRGADGVRLADVNGDGRPDVVTGWEQGGITRIYLHPGREPVRQRWPAVTVGRNANS